jgi:hypothetical protein
MDSITNIFKVVATDSVIITTVVGGSHIRGIDIQGSYNEPAAVQTPSVSATVVKTEFYTVSGILAGNRFANLRKGLYIQKTYYNDGNITKSKFVKALD